ncbi:MAG: tetratricopeptide repeat protein, partial [Paraglaciecola sp.]|nr:tetratricopeptide repeat protein [Paraglaciecola sp.]
MNTSNILLRAISVTLLLVTLAACTKHDASYYIDLAKSAEQSGNVNEAVLHYKSAIGLEPQNTSYREALGLLYSKAGDLESAIKELELAAKTTPLSLALFYHLLENHYFLEADQRVVSLYKEHADSFQASEIFHATIIAIVANRRMGNLQFAKQLAEKLQTINRSVYQGLLAYIDNNYSEALAKLRENEDVMTQRVGTTLILAELASASADHRYSVTLYEKVTNAIPDFLPFQLFLANGYILIEQFDNAQPIITKLIKGYPNHPYINYLSSILKIKKNDLEGAKLAAEKAISYGFNTPQVKSIAGIANYFLGNYESAYKNLKYLTEEKGPKGFLYGVYLAASIELGYSEDALSNLSADGGGEETNKLTAFFAQQILQNRSLSLADQLIYERLSKPGAALNKQTAIAATVIGDSAMWPDLISFVNQHLEDEFLVQLFIAQQIRNQQFDTALDIAKRWQQTKPEALNANQTLSLTYALSGQPLQAIKQAEYTLVRFPNDLASTFLLHKVRASDAGYAEAKQAMEAVFAIEQLHVGAFRFLREKVTTIVEMRDFTTFLEGTLVKAGVTDSELNIMLFELKLALNQSQSVIDALALRDLSSMDDKYSIILAQAYVNLGKPEKSIELLKSKLTHSPGSSLLVSALLSVQATMQNYSAVFNTLDRRMQSVESDSQLLILKADYQIASGDVTAASASLASVKNPSPFQSAMIDMLNGKIAFKQGRYA